MNNLVDSLSSLHGIGGMDAFTWSFARSHPYLFTAIELGHPYMFVIVAVIGINVVNRIFGRGRG